MFLCTGWQRVQTSGYLETAITCDGVMLTIAILACSFSLVFLRPVTKFDDLGDADALAWRAALQCFGRGLIRCVLVAGGHFNGNWL